MATQQVTATSTEQTILFETPCLGFEILVPSTETGNALIVPIGYDLKHNNQAVCVPGERTKFKHTYCTGFKYQRETVDALVNFYITEY